MTEQDRIRLVARAWWSLHGAIKGRDGQIIQPPRLNSLQRQIDDATEWCELEGEPCRLIVLKPRKEGATTWIVGKSYHLVRSSEAHLLQIGDQYQTTQTMWDMLRLYARRDTFTDWAGRVTRLTQDAKSGSLECSHGATAWTDTAGDRRAGQSKTPTIIHCEEVAHWRGAQEIMLALLNSIADLPGTYVFVASTANGVGGWYHGTFGGAVTLAQRRKGILGNGWIRIFSAWHESPWSHREVSPEAAQAILSSLTPIERQGKTLYGWTTGQMAFRRHTIASRCDGRETGFSQEYPSDSTSCFIQGGSPRFDLDGVTKIMEGAKTHVDRFGSLEQQPGGRLTWLESPQGWVWMREQPVVGGRYVGFADPMTGEQSEGSAKRDTHACGILRDAYVDQRGQHPAELVACIHGVGPHGEPGECRWDMDQLVEKFYRLVRWYGDCMVIPEANNAGVEFIRLAQQIGMTMWRREKPMDSRSGKKLEIYGFQTTAASRRLWVGSCAQYVREQTLAVRYRPWAEQFQTFVTDDHGDGKALEGTFDDAVTGIGMGLILIQSGNAQLYSPVSQPFVQPNYFGEQSGNLLTSGRERFNALS